MMYHVPQAGFLWILRFVFIYGAIALGSISVSGYYIQSENLWLKILTGILNIVTLFFAVAAFLGKDYRIISLLKHRK